MNILPKKSWHVRRPENKERVRRDEENARLEERKEQERIALAEKEARIAYLRKKNAAGFHDEGGEKQILITDTQNGHLNLFTAEENAGSSGFKNVNEEYVKEKRDEQEKLEKRIGLLTYVGQSQLEGEAEGKLWYLENRVATKTKPVEESSESEVEEPKKLKLDPLSVIEKHTKHDKRTKKEHKKKKKRKKEKEEIRKTISSSAKSIQVLREERLRREQKERQRTEALLSQGCEVSEEAKIGNDNNKYFSQFNPELARRKGKR